MPSMTSIARLRQLETAGNVEQLGPEERATCRSCGTAHGPRPAHTDAQVAAAPLLALVDDVHRELAQEQHALLRDLARRVGEVHDAVIAVPSVRAQEAGEPDPRGMRFSVRAILAHADRNGSAWRVAVRSEHEQRHPRAGAMYRVALRAANGARSGPFLYCDGCIVQYLRLCRGCGHAASDLAAVTHIPTGGGEPVNEPLCGYCRRNLVSCSRCRVYAEASRRNGLPEGWESLGDNLSACRACAPLYAPCGNCGRRSFETENARRFTRLAPNVDPVLALPVGRPPLQAIAVACTCGNPYDCDCDIEGGDEHADDCDRYHLRSCPVRAQSSAPSTGAEGNIAIPPHRLTNGASAIALSADGRYRVEAGGVCPHCSGSIWSYCAVCRLFHPSRDLAWPCQGGMAYAPDAFGWAPPMPRFFATDAEKREPFLWPDVFIGFELEIERSGVSKTRESLCRAIAAPWLYFKADGSLNDGIEIVSQPMSWAFIREHADDLATRWRWLTKQGCRSYNTNTCGLHIHIPKAAFTRLRLLKFMLLLYGNVKWAEGLSQRKGNFRYCSLTKEHARNLPRKARHAQGNPDTDRYVAVNLEPRHTVEVRLFKGTLLPQSFFKAIEFVVAAYEWAGQASLVEAQSTTLFTQWVARNRRSFPNLHAFLETKMAAYTDDVEVVTPSVLGPQATVLARRVASAEGVAAILAANTTSQPSTTAEQALLADLGPSASTLPSFRDRVRRIAR